MPVPTTRQVLPGAGVNIVLKEDQPTGRTVSGVVRDVLTRGNHPRGIKVRLADGRVGRVQSMGNGQVTGLDEGAEIGYGSAGGAGGGSDEGQGFGGRRGRKRRDMYSEGEEVPGVRVGLDAYIKPAKQRGKRRGNATSGGLSTGDGVAREVSWGEAVERTGAPAGAGQQEGTVRCPVCGDFEGDEAAVAHHVAGHFDA